MDSILKSHLCLLLLDVDAITLDFVTKEKLNESDSCLYLLDLVRNAIDEIEFFQEDLSAFVFFSDFKL